MSEIRRENAKYSCSGQVEGIDEAASGPSAPSRPAKAQVAKIASRIQTRHHPPHLPRTVDFVVFGRKKQQHAAEEPEKGRPSQRTPRREPKRARQSPEAQTLMGVRRQGSSRTATLWISQSGRKQRTALSKRSREVNPCRRAGGPWIDEGRQGFPAPIKTTHFSVGLPWLTFLRPGEMPIFNDREEENPQKSGSFLSCHPHRWAASQQKTS